MSLLPTSSARFLYHLGSFHSFLSKATIPSRSYSVANTPIPADVIRRCHSHDGKSFSQKRTHPRGSNITRAFTNSTTSSESQTTPNDVHLGSTSPPEPFYTGPLAAAYHRVKLFSISSLGLAAALTPVIFIVEAPIPTSARAALALTAVVASGSSTALIAWCGAPYVQSIRHLAPSAPSTGVAMSTKSFWMKDLHTEIYDTTFLGQTTRAFAKWELVSLIRMQRTVARQPGTQEIVARTRDKAGKVLGEWVIDWNADDSKAEEAKDHVLGRGHAKGSIVRHFNVHEELL